MHIDAHIHSGIMSIYVQECSELQLSIESKQRDWAIYNRQIICEDCCVMYTVKTEVLNIIIDASFLTLPKSARRDNTRSVTQSPCEV